MNYYNYFTEVEEHFSRRRGKGLLVSPLDWALIATWRDSGIPLHIALRGIDVAMDSYQARLPRRSEKLNRLVYCHDSVMSEYVRHLETHVGESRSEAPAPGESSIGVTGERDGAEGPDRETVEKFLAARIAEIRNLTAKRLSVGGAEEEIGRILHRLEEIVGHLPAGQDLDLEALERDLGILDQDLVSLLRSCIPDELAAGWEKEAKVELKVYRKRLPREAYEHIRGNYMRKRVHLHFDIGELSLFHI